MPYPRDRQSGRRVQYAALPYRIHRDGAVQVRLITSRETRRWVIPKGWPMKSLSPPKAAARETYEEAGLVGTVSREPLGIYTYEKRLGLRSVLCDVLVFPLKVKRMLQKFPEQSQRFGVWFSIESAAAAVQEEDLKALILAFGDAIARKQAKARDKRKDAADGALAGEPAPPETAGADKPPKTKAAKAKPSKAKPLKAKAGVAAVPADAAGTEAPPAPEQAVKPVVRPKAGKAQIASTQVEGPATGAGIAEGASGKMEKKAKVKASDKKAPPSGVRPAVAPPEIEGAAVAVAPGKAEKKAKVKAGAAKPKAPGRKALPSAGPADAADGQAAGAPLAIEDAAVAGAPGKAEKKAKVKAGAAKPKVSGKKASPAAGKATEPKAKTKAPPPAEAGGKGKAAAKGKAASRRGKEPVAVE